MAEAPSDAPQSLPRLSVRRNFSWIALGNLVNAACCWGRVLLLARIGNAEMIGQLVLAFAVCNPINTMADLGLSGVLISDATGKYRFWDYLGLRLITAVLAMVLIFSAAWTGQYDGEMFGMVSLAGLAVVLESVCDIFHARLQQHERMDFVAISLMVRGPMGLGLLTLGTWWTGDLRWGLLGFSVAAAATLLLVDAPCAARVGALRTDRLKTCPPERLKTRGAKLAALAWLSLPLGLAGASVALATSLPRYAISHYLGREALGGFAVAGGLLVATSLMVGAMSQAAGPRLAQFYATRNSAAIVGLLCRLMASVAATGLVLLAVMVVLGGPILGLLYGSQFSHFANLALVLTIAAVLKDLVTPLGRALNSMQRFKTNMVLRVGSVLAFAAILPGMVDQRLGLMGAAWAMVLVWLLTLLASAGLVILVVRKMRQ